MAKGVHHAERKEKLARKLFSLEDQDTAGRGFTPKSDREKAIKVAANVGALVLADLAGNCRKAWGEMGPGALVIRHACEDAVWMSPDDLKEQLDTANRYGDEGIADVLERTIERIGCLDPEKDCLLLIADERGLRLIQLPLDNHCENLAQYMGSLQ